MTALKRRAASLFEDDSDGGSDDHDAKLTIDSEYARRFEHNKRRTELHRLEAKHPEVAARIQARELARAARGDEAGDDDDDEESTDDEDDGYLDPAQEKAWADALIKIKSKDPSIYDSSTRLFADAGEGSDDDGGLDDDEDGADEAAASKGKARKAKTLRQVLFDQAVQEEQSDDLEPDTELDRRRRLRDDRARNMAYDEEQRKLKRDLLNKLEAVDDGAGDDSGGLTKKRTLAVDTAKDEDTVEVQQKLDQFFGRRAAANRDDAFLHNYLTRRLWAAGDDDDAPGPQHGDDDDDEAAARPPTVVDDEDDEFLDRADDFERQYNFRSEEPGGHNIQTFPRQIDATARKSESKRKRQRESKQEREAAAKAAREDELKRLKNLKKKDVHDALSQLRAVAGKAAPQAAVLDALLNSDFDPDAWDSHMAQAFDEAYYGEAEREDDVLQDDAAMQAAAAWAAGEGDEGDTFAAVHKRVTGRDDLTLPENDYDVAPRDEGDDADEDEMASGDDEADEDDEDDDGGADTAQLARSRDKVQALLEEYYKLDYEDDVGGLKTRFHYRQVDPVRDTLDASEILAMTDKELNAIVGLKRLAPYRDDAGKVRPNYNALTEARNRLRKLGFKQDKAPKAKRRKTASGSAAEDAGGAPERPAASVATRKPRAGAAPAEESAERPKKKRPGPALRRALKEQQEKGPIAGDASTRQPVNLTRITPAEGASVDDSAPADDAREGGAAPPGDKPRHTTKGSGAKPHKADVQGQQAQDKAAKAKRRLESFAKLSLPGQRNKSTSGGPGVEPTSKVKLEKSPTEPVSAAAEASLTRSQKKNMKRALKRRTAKPDGS